MEDTVLSRPAPTERPFSRDHVLSVLQEAARSDATEVHFKVPCLPMMRVGGLLRPLGNTLVTTRDAVEIGMNLAGLAGIEVLLKDDIEFAFGLAKIGRFRVSIYRQRGSHAVVVHRIRVVPPTLEELNQKSAAAVLGRPGLSLVSGPRATDVLHALVDEYNRTHNGHLVLAESRLAYLHKDTRAIISHRELGSDCSDFRNAIACGMRSAADQIVLGEIPDADTFLAVLDAAESGTPTIAAVRTNSPDPTSWLLRTFWGDQRMALQQRLKAVLATTVYAGVDAR